MKRYLPWVFGCLALSNLTLLAEIRSFSANFTDTPPVVDGILSEEEWGATEADWSILNSDAPDETENRFSAKWDLNGIYFLHTTNYGNWAEQGLGQIDFDYETVQLFFDPNTDNETNEQFDANDTGIDGYHLAVNQPLGNSGYGAGLSAEFQSAGFFSEAHVNSLDGDQGQPWSGFRNVQIRQRTDANAGGVTEMFVPWRNFNATNPAFGFDPDLGDDIGLYHPDSPAPGAEWYFNIGRVQSDGTTIGWSIDDGEQASLNNRPHGILRFVEEVTLNLSCDFDADLDCDADDIDRLTDAVLAGLEDVEYDLDQNQQVDHNDRVAWVNDPEYKHTWFGDSNLDGEFGSADLVAVFEAGEYEDGIPGNSGWATGDWGGDKDFTTADLVVAFQHGGYELGPRQKEAVIAVPEPHAGVLLMPAILFAYSLLRRRNS